MKKILILKFTFFCALGLTSPKSFGYPSLFQTHKENTHSKNTLTLSALLYSDSCHWTLWLNDQKITSDTKNKLETVIIKDVTPEDVTFSWVSSDSDQMQIFTLRPGQTFEIEGQTKIEDE